MIVKLNIAGVRWQCSMPDMIFNESILRFGDDFHGPADINLEIRYTNYYDLPEGKSITDEILEWYILKDGAYRYRLLKREDDNDNIIVSLKANELWSVILIEIRYNNPFSIEFVNILLLEIVFRNRLIFHDGLVLHASSIDIDGEAIAFAAPSGTGKSTHARNWKEVYRANIINDDHPAIRIFDGRPVMFGTPWAGEGQKFSNITSNLKAVVLLEQGPHNKMWRVSEKEILRELLPRCFMPYYNNEYLLRAIAIFSEIVKSTQVYKLICKPDQEAVLLVQNSIWSEKYDNGMIKSEQSY
jgi:hypothetical protein